MAGKRRGKVTERQITRLKYFDKLAPLWSGCTTTAVPAIVPATEKLHYDQYVHASLLLYLFNPIVHLAARACEQASELAWVQKKLGCPRAARFALGSCHGVFDPQRRIAPEDLLILAVEAG